MKINLPIAGLLLGAWLLPVAGYAADSATKTAVPPSANETPGAEMTDNGRASPSHRSVHPVDDSVITSKIKGKFVKDKQVRADNIEIETVDGAVNLTGTARTRAKAAHATALARQVAGVKSVKNNIQIDPANTAAASDKTDRTADNRRSDDDRGAHKRGSDQPVADSWITTKVKAKFVKDKQVKARNIEVKTLDGVVQLSGIAGSSEESSRAAELARNIKGVKSVTNDIEVK
jgi:hyperosmotically inducible protein